MKLLSTKGIAIVLSIGLVTNSLLGQISTDDFISQFNISNDLEAPGRMAIDTDDNIYVTDAIQRRINKYDNQGIFVGAIEPDLNPLSIAINSKNELFVGDQETGNIYKVDPSGSKSLFYSGISLPNAMVFGSNKILYITDSKQNKVIGLNVAGAVVTEFTHSTFTFITGIAFDAQNDHIIVSEHGGIGEDMECGGGCSICWSSTGPQTSIYIFNLDGSFVSSFGCFGEENGLFHRIQGITVGACGNIYAADPYLGRVTVFDENGNYVAIFGQQGDGLGEFNLPMDIVFNSDDQFFVSSMNKGEIDVFSINRTLPTSTIVGTDEMICAGTTADILIKFTGIAPWTFTYTVDGDNPIEITTNEANYYLEASIEGKYQITSLSDGENLVGTCFTGSKDIQVNSVLPTATFLEQTIARCDDASSDLLIEFTGEAPWTFTYTIEGQQSTEITTTQSPYALNADQEGLYEIISLSDAAGCIGDEIIDNTSVTIYPKPTSVILNGNDRIYIPEGGLAELNVQFTGTAPWTFIYVRDEQEPISITTSENPYTFSVSKEGTYEILETQDAYCFSTITDGYPEIVFESPEPPTAIFETDINYVCEGNSATIPILFTGIAPWTFSYTVDGEIIESISTSDSTFLLESTLLGVYQIDTIVDGSNLLGTSEGSLTLIAYETPFIDIPENLAICEGNSTELNPGDFESYLWNDGSTTQTLEVETPGVYTVTVVDQNGCSATASSSVTLNSLPEVDLGSEVNICEGDPIYILDAGVHNSYLWSDGSTNQTLEVSASGIYSVTVTNEYGCSASDWVQVNVLSLPDAYFYYDVSALEVQFVHDSFYTDSHYWEFGDGTSSTEANPIHNYASKGTYTVTYTALSDFCGNSIFTESIKVEGKPNNEVIDIYPNPSTGEFTIIISPNDPILGQINILITSTSGQYLYSGTFDPNLVTSYNGNYYIDINIESFTKGIYIVSINAGNFVGQDKLILKD